MKKDLEIIQLMEEVIELSKEKDQLLQELSKTKDKMIAFFESQPPKPQMKVVFRR
ncbi:MAG: hypothetical protein JW833_05980 [Prolixibacteraceae bacterium]|nr:hypothetical protein [Prolixibacteraceae bacterium]